MATGKDNEKRVLKDWRDEEFMKDEQNQVKRKNHWAILFSNEKITFPSFPYEGRILKMKLLDLSLTIAIASIC